MFFFFNDTAPTEIYPLSLHDALPILPGRFLAVCWGFVRWRNPPLSRHRPRPARIPARFRAKSGALRWFYPPPHHARSEEHTSELQSRQYLVCRLLLEKKKK